MLLQFLICFGLASFTTGLPTTGLQVLFPTAETRQSTYEIKSNISCGTLAPIESDSYWTLEGKLLVQVVDNFTRVRYTLHDLKTSIFSKNHGYLSYKKVDAAKFLNKPWEVEYQEDGNIKTLYVTPEEPLWATNMKRALSINFQIKKDVGTYSNFEPCLYQAYTDCSVVYVASGKTIRKYNSLHILSEQSGYSSWMSVPMDLSKAAFFGGADRRYEEYSGPLDNIGTADRVYELDEYGLVSLELKSVFQHKTRSHVLAVTTELSLKFENDAPRDQIDKIDLVKTSKRYVGHDYSDPTNGIRNYTQNELRNKTFEILLRISSTGIDADNIVKDASKIHSLDLVNLLKTMAQLDYQALSKLFEDIVLGTSYDIETSRNIFLEVLPHVRTNACALFIKYLIVEQTAKIEEATLLSLIRKLPFNVANHSQSLLEELEVFTRLSPDYTQEVRHAAILSFATLVYKTAEVGKVKQDYFDDIVVKYFRMYNDCPQYIDKLVWLQGLSNIQYSIEPYMRTIYNNNKNNRHDRLWAILATTQSNSAAGLSATWHVIMNSQEHIQLRIAALHGFLSSPTRPSELLSLHHYLTTCDNEQLKRFWFTTVNSLENSRPYNCYRVASNYIPFLKNQISNPDTKYWATGNYIVGTYDDETATGAMLQMMSIADPKSGLPTVLQFRLKTVSELMATSDIGVFIKAEGVATSMFQKIHTVDSEDLNVEQLLEILKKMKVQTVTPEKVHIEIVVKVHDRTVYATHFNQSRFDRWRGEDLTKSIEDFLRFGSHINQQVVYYPFQLDANIPTELGTPVRLQTAIVSFSSIRGNLTAPSSKDLTWRNDLHLRYLGTAVTSLCTDGPLMKSEHTVRVQQSVVSHLPMKFEVSFSPLNKSLTLKWPNPTAQKAGLAMHARAQVAMESLKGKDTYTVNAGNGRSKSDDSGIFFDCDRPMTMTEVVEKLLASHTFNYDFLTKLRPSVLILNGLLLLSAPPSGSCGLLIGGRRSFQGFHTGQIRSVLELTMKCDELKLTHDDLLAIKFGNSLVYRENKPNGAVFMNVTGSVHMQSAEGNATIDLALVGENPNKKRWKICLSQHETNHGPIDQDISANPAAYDGHLTMAYAIGKDEQSCLANDTISSTLNVEYKGTPSDEEKHLEVYVRGNKLPNLDFLTDNGFGTQPGFGHLLHDLEKEPLHVTAIVKEKDGLGTVRLNRGAEIKFKKENFAWLMDSWSNMQLMKKFGIYRECRLTDSTVLTLSGDVEHLPPVDGLENLALADCTDKPRFAVLRTKGGGIKLYTGGHYVLLTRVDGEVVVTVNDEEKECNMKCSFPADQIQPDFKITRLGSDVKIHSRVSGVQVYYRQDGTVILAPHSYMTTACGSCQAQHYYKLT